MKKNYIFNRLRSITVMLSLTAAFAAMPLTVSAATVSADYTLYLNDADGLLYKNNASGNNVTAEMNAAGAVVTGSAGARVLTLTNFSFETTTNTALLVHANMNIVLVGTNTLTSTNSGGTDSYGIYVQGDLNIGGSGSLETTSGNASTTYGIFALYNIIVKGGTVVTTGMGNGIGIQTGIGTLTINGGTITAIGNFRAFGADYTVPSGYIYTVAANTAGTSPTTGTSTGTFTITSAHKYAKIEVPPADYTLYLNNDGKLYKNNASGDDITTEMNAKGAVTSVSAGVCVLTLTNFDFETTVATALDVTNGSTIVLEGANSIRSIFGGGTVSYGIYKNGGSLVIKSETGGSLNVKGGDTSGNNCPSYGIYAYQCSITINGNVEVEATSGEVTSTGYGDSYGIYTYYYSNITISDNAKVIANGGKAYGTSYSSIGIAASSGGSIMINGNAEVEAVGNSTYYGSSSGMYGTNVTISGNSKVTATSGDCQGSSTGINASSGVTINDNAEVTATGGAASYYSSCGISASNGNLTISGNAKVTATGATAGSYPHGSFGITAGSNFYGTYLDFIGGTVIARGETRAVSDGFTSSGDYTVPSGYEYDVATDVANTTGQASGTSDGSFVVGSTHKYAKIEYAAPNTPQTITAATYSAAPYSVGNLITATAGTYTANDGGAAGTHTYKWYRADDSGGTGEAVIGGAVALSYTPVTADFGRWICIETTPVGDGSLTGTPVKSSYIQIGVKITASATGAGGASAITVDGTAGATGKVFYDTTPISIVVTKNTATDGVAWTASGGVGSFGSATSESTTFTPPASPAGDIALTATLTAANTPPTITSGSSTLVINGTGGTFQVTATGTAPITYALSGQPAGVSINSSSGLITIAATTAINTYSFTITATNGTSPNASQTFTLTVTAPPIPPVPSLPPTSYTVNIGIFQGGSVKANRTTATAGDIVTLTVSPEMGYESDAITVHRTGSPATTVSLSGTGNTRSFTMPAGNVTVDATFRKTAQQTLWEKARAIIENAAYNVQQQYAGTPEQLAGYLANYINGLLSAAGVNLTLTPENIWIESDRFLPATSGTNGSFAFFVLPAGVIGSNLNSGIIVASTVGIETQGLASLQACVQHGVLYVRGLPAGAEWRVYNVMGTLIYNGVASDVETQCIASLPSRGIYLVTDGKTTVKVVN